MGEQADEPMTEREKMIARADRAIARDKKRAAERRADRLLAKAQVANGWKNPTQQDS